MLNIKQVPLILCVAVTMISTTFSTVAEARPPFDNGNDDIPSEIRDRIRDNARNNRRDRDRDDIPSEIRDRIRDRVWDN